MEWVRNGVYEWDEGIIIVMQFRTNRMGMSLK